MEQEKHTMVLKQEFPDGSQEWECPQCGRRFIMQWPPHYKRTILEQGDNFAVHAGGTGGLVMGDSEMIPESSQLTPESAAEEAFLAPQTPEPFSPVGDLPVESLDLPGGESEEDDHYLAPFLDWLDARDQ